MQFEVYEGSRRLLAQRLAEGRTVLGRSDLCDLSLPFDTVSRTHLALERSRSQVVVENLGSVGAQLDGRALTRAPLELGSVVRFGTLSLRLVAAEDTPHQAHTATQLVTPATHEDLVGALGQVAASRALLEFERGPWAGQTRMLERRRTTISGPGAHLPMGDPDDPHPVVFRVVRGRVMVQPGGQAVYISGQRARELTPLLFGEPVRVGDHVFTVRERVVEEHNPRKPASFGRLVGTSPVMRAVFDTLERVARHDATVLLTGATGTGKELAARALHDQGPRRDGPFVALNCATFPAELIESELFGVEKGAYTGADVRRDGAFQRAAGGTLFLDELGEMSLDLQAKLLRTLETGEVRRVGGQRVSFPDVRVVAATHRDLRQLVRTGGFRQDLFFRVGVLQVRMPSLAEHLDDLPELVARLLANDHPGAAVEADALLRLQQHPWPGNVRELRNVLTRAVVLHGGSPVRAAHLSFDDFEAPAAPSSPDEAEKLALQRALEDCGGNRSMTARALGIPRTTLLYKLRRHGLD